MVDGEPSPWRVRPRSLVVLDVVVVPLAPVVAAVMTTVSALLLMKQASAALAVLSFMVLMLNDYYVCFGVSIDDASFQLWMPTGKIMIDCSVI